MTLFDRLTQAVERSPPADLLTGDRIEGHAHDSASAAVLMAVTDRSEPGIILTTRRPDLRRHPGQIAFPGGRLDAGETPIAGALREAEEEVGLNPAAVRIAGLLDPYRTITGYHVTPVLGLVPPDLPLNPQESEVAELFEAPLAYLLDSANQLRKSALFEGYERHYYEILWNGRRIWGATAAMIVNLSKRLQWP